MRTSRELSASQEDYMEAIFHILDEKEAVLAKDIALRLNVSRPSVTGALRVLAGHGLVNHEPYGIITLTESGHKTAKDIVRRHSALRDFFVTILEVGEEEAESAACAVEHCLSKKIVDKLAAITSRKRKKV